MGITEAVMIGALTIVFLVLSVILSSLYQKCGPNEAMIVSGANSEGQPRIFCGGGTIVVPMIQRVDILNLEVMSIELKSTTSYLSANRTIFEFDGVMEASIGSSVDEIKCAAQQFGGKDARDIRSIIYDIAQDCIRSCFSKANDDELAVIDPIAEDIKDIIQAEVNKYGIRVQGVRIREIRQAKKPKANLSSTVEVLKLGNSSVKIDDSLDGSLAIVTKTISNDSEGEITYKIANSSQRVTLLARPKLPGKDIEIGSIVIIKNITDEVAEVTPWSDVFYHYPSVVV